jgi:DNA-binding MarR family transcriptional regulator
VTSEKRQEELQAHLASIDRLTHEPARIAIMSVLYVVESVDFVFLRNQTGMTAGNLSSHISKLEEAGYVRVNKEFVGKRPHTTLSLTPEGMRAFEEYRSNLEAVLRSMPG